MSSTGVTHHLTMPKWPEPNGEVKRQNRSLMKRIKIAYTERRDNRTEIDTYLVAYTFTHHSVTGKGRAEMLLGRKLGTKLPMLPDVFDDDKESRDRGCELKNSMVACRNNGKTPHKIKM